MGPIDSACCCILGVVTLLHQAEGGEGVAELAHNILISCKAVPRR